MLQKLFAQTSSQIVMTVPLAIHVLASFSQCAENPFITRFEDPKYYKNGYLVTMPPGLRKLPTHGSSLETHTLKELLKV